MPQRPNILFLFADQMRYDCIGTLNPAIRTPALDRLAGGGVNLTGAYAPTPVCLPCRAAVVTGQYPSTNRATHNTARLEQDHNPLISDLLHEAGYFTHMIGKSHLSPCHDPAGAEAAPHIHNRQFFRKWHGPWYGFRRADIAIGHSTEAHACGMHYGAWLEDHGVDIDKYFGHTEYEQCGAWDLPEEYHSSKWIADVAISGIERAAETGRPFFTWANFQDPHNPCMVPEPWASMYRGKDIPLGGFKPGEPECFDNKPPLYREILQAEGPYSATPSDPGLDGAGNVCHLGYDKETHRRNTECYYGMVSLMDHHIGRILDALERTGQAANTLIVFTADHGDLLGDHGMWYKSLVAYDESMRVPMIVRYPGNVPEGTSSGALQNLVDLAPTFLDYAGLPAEVRMEGVSQRQTWENPDQPVRTDTVVEERPGDKDWNQRVLINERYKLAFYADRNYGELYDRIEDPDQVNNLWDDPQYASIRQSMIARILSHEMNKTAPLPGQSPTYAHHAEKYRLDIDRA